VIPIEIIVLYGPVILSCSPAAPAKTAAQIPLDSTAKSGFLPYRNRRHKSISSRTGLDLILNRVAMLNTDLNSALAL
jgi:hypothetical protein